MASAFDIVCLILAALVGLLVLAFVVLFTIGTILEWRERRQFSRKTRKSVADAEPCGFCGKQGHPADRCPTARKFRGEYPRAHVIPDANPLAGQRESMWP